MGIGGLLIIDHRMNYTDILKPQMQDIQKEGSNLQQQQHDQYPPAQMQKKLSNLDEKMHTSHHCHVSKVNVYIFLVK